MPKRKSSRARANQPLVEAPGSDLAVSEAGLIEQFVAALMTNPEFKEAFTQADLELALEDRDWIGGLGGMASEKWTSDLQPQQRRLLIERSRMYWHRDPLAHQAVRLWTDYCFGDVGMTFEVTNRNLKKQLEGFVDDPRNRMYFSPYGQKRLSNKLLVDGDLFMAIFEDGTVRAFDPLQMTLVKDPDDEDIVLGYQRVTQSGKTLYYSDWAYVDRADELQDPKTINMYNSLTTPPSRTPIKVEQDVVIYRLPFDPLGLYGNGLLNTSTAWSSSHRRFMQARVNLLEALSKIAYKLTVKGGANAVQAAKVKLQSTMVDGGTTNGVERNPPATSSSTYIGNAGADLQQMPRATGAGDAKGDSDNLKLMVSSGTGIMLHYFGDPSTGNLATATAMELPMLKQFGSYQVLWKGALKDMFAILSGKKPTELQATINLPEILDPDLQKLGAFLQQLTGAFPEAKQPPVLRKCLVSMGIDDVDDVMDLAAATRATIDAQTDLNNKIAMVKAGVKKDDGDAGLPNPPNGSFGADYTERFAKLTEAVTKLSEML